jgi:dephospho-CoA kinase
MLKVGLTGGIGCGKSTVAKIFVSINVPILDADAIAHQLVETGRPALAQIQQTFGTHILNPDGSLNRAALREQIFSDATQKQLLEAILHPLIYATLQSELEQLNTPYCIISIPLLFETNMTHFVDRILVIDCPVETQIERVTNRDKLTPARIQSIIDSQVSRAFRKSKADDLINNSGTDYRLAEQVKKLHNLYLSLSDCQD